MNPDNNTTSSVGAANWTAFYEAIELLSRRLEAANFPGVDGAEIVREGREERGCCADTTERETGQQFIKIGERNSP